MRTIKELIELAQAGAAAEFTTSIQEALTEVANDAIEQMAEGPEEEEPEFDLDDDIEDLPLEEDDVDDLDEEELAKQKKELLQELEEGKTFHYDEDERKFIADRKKASYIRRRQRKFQYAESAENLKKPYDHKKVLKHISDVSSFLKHSGKQEDEDWGPGEGDTSRADAKDYDRIHHLSKAGKHEEAVKHWHSLDTMARDHAEDDTPNGKHFARYVGHHGDYGARLKNKYSREKLLGKKEKYDEELISLRDDLTDDEIEEILDTITEEHYEMLDELSKNLLTRYMAKADKHAFDDDQTDKGFHRASSARQGFGVAASKIAGAARDTHDGFPAEHPWHSGPLVNKGKGPEGKRAPKVKATGKLSSHSKKRLSKLYRPGYDLERGS